MAGNESMVVSGARTFLRGGAIAGLFYLAVGLAQALVSDGFDLMRHPLSLLANGPGGWVQTANFLLSGLLVVAAAVGFARALAPRGRAASFFLGVFGVSMLAAAVFPADPVDGFPVGTPVGPPTSITTRGLLHFVAGALGFTALGISALCAASATRHHMALSRLSLVSGLAVLIGFFGGFLIPGVGTLGIWFSVVVGWAWLLVLSLRLARASA